MQCATSLESLEPLHQPIALTIGNFDGVHLGHQALLRAMKQQVKLQGGSVVVVSFRNHPTEVLRPNLIPPALCSTEHKIALIQEADVDLLLLLEFTAELANKSAEEFLDLLLTVIPFKFLFFGPDGAIGRNREGDKEHLAELAQKKQFTLMHLPPYLIHGQRVSSSQIRNLVMQGELSRAETLLGRPYTVFSRVISGLGKGRVMGAPTANLPVEGLCLPPFGVWIASCHIGQKQYAAIANLGCAPTIRNDLKPLLEVYLLDQSVDLLEQSLEVRFHLYLRPEERFADVDTLKVQIQKDIQAARNYWSVHHL